MCRLCKAAALDLLSPLCSDAPQMGATREHLAGPVVSGPTSSAEVEVKPLVKHIISKEHQLYYMKITEAVLSRDELLSGAAISTLSGDSGLQQLLPTTLCSLSRRMYRRA